MFDRIAYVEENGGNGGMTYLKITDGGNAGWNITVKDYEDEGFILGAKIDRTRTIRRYRKRNFYPSS